MDVDLFRDDDGIDDFIKSTVAKKTTESTSYAVNVQIVVCNRCSKNSTILTSISAIFTFVAPIASFCDSSSILLKSPNSPDKN